MLSWVGNISILCHCWNEYKTVLTPYGESVQFIPLPIQKWRKHIFAFLPSSLLSLSSAMHHRLMTVTVTHNPTRSVTNWNTQYMSQCEACCAFHGNPSLRIVNYGECNTESIIECNTTTVCGSDGVTYSNGCERKRAAQENACILLAHTGNCVDERHKPLYMKPH